MTEAIAISLLTLFIVYIVYNFLTLITTISVGKSPSFIKKKIDYAMLTLGTVSILILSFSNHFLENLPYLRLIPIMFIVFYTTLFLIYNRK